MSIMVSSVQMPKASQKSLQIVLGGFLVEAYFKNPKRILKSADLEEAAKSLGIDPTNIAGKMKPFFENAIVFDGNGNYGLNPDYTPQDFLEFVNILRKKAGLSELKAEKEGPSLIER